MRIVNAVEVVAGVQTLVELGVRETIVMKSMTWLHRAEGTEIDEVVADHRTDDGEVVRVPLNGLNPCWTKLNLIWFTKAK